MATKSPKTGRQVSAALQAARFLFAPQRRGLVLSVVVMFVSLGGLIAAWNRWGAPSTSAAEYAVTPDKIAVTPPPAWIHADVKAEVAESANLNQLDLRHAGLVEQVSRAFASHAWVAQVVRVEKRYPAQVIVELQYRRPAAAVEVTSQGQAGLLFVDAEGVLLPSADFASNQGDEYPRIAVGQSSPAGYGLPWGDEGDRVAGAARIAAAWGERFRAAGLYRIIAAQGPGRQVTYELQTPGQTRVIWGLPPGREAAGEPSAEQKVAALLAHISDKGPLDRPDGERLIDLRTR
jgi:hypothetical protein